MSSQRRALRDEIFGRRATPAMERLDRSEDSTMSMRGAARRTPRQAVVAAFATDGLKRAPLWRYGGAVLIVLISALSVEVLYVVLNTTRLSMVLLAGVLAAAVTRGARPGYLAAALAFLIYDFYLSAPRFELTIGSPEDVIVLLTFLFVAVLTGGLAGRARDEGRKAQHREASARTLYEASRELSAIGDEDAIRDRLAARIVAIARSSFCFWTEDLAMFNAIGAPPPLELEVQAFWLLDSSTPSISHVVWRDAWRIRRLRHDAPDLGLVAWRVEGTREEVTAIDTIVNILVDLGAAAIVRARLSARQGRIDAMAKTEQLRNALLSSVSHDFRTPLAVILASASALRELFDDLDRAGRDDLLSTIQEEAERLNRFIANLLQISKLEAGVVQVRSAEVDLGEVVDEVVRRCARGRNAGRLTTRLCGQGLLARGDAILLEHAIGNVVENALRFSEAGRPVILSGRKAGDRVDIVVTDNGPGVDPRDMERIFEKFFQSGPPRLESSGAGLGLSIARGLLEAMQGKISAENRAGGSGLSVTMTLPAAR
jgi:K+-sensing histidine kinase KdpD